MKQFFTFFAGVCALAILAINVHGEQAGGPKVGDKAPAFEAKNDEGKVWKSSDVVGKKIVVVYFYPADFTGGCTKQACSFRDHEKELTDKGIVVVGVSADSVATHAAFKKEHELKFTLLSDPNGAVAKQFGVPFNAKKANAKFKNETFVREGTASRWTAVIATDGNIMAFYEVKGDTAADSKKVLETVEKLKK